MKSPIRILSLAACLAAGWGVIIATVSADPGPARPPALAKAPTTTQPIFESIQTDFGHKVSVLNPTAGWMTISIEMTFSNAKASVPMPILFALAPRERRDIAEIRPINVAASSNWRYTTNYVPGNFKYQAEPDDHTLYRLPYATNARHEVLQGYRGKFSHFSPDEYAVDFGMPVGTNVCAALAGEVVAIKADSDVGGPSRGFQEKANYILIAHADGTVGNYAHLKHDGVLVKVGQQVKAGDVIGLSGNTGWSSEPHLHFDVKVPVDSRRSKTVPVKFATGAGRAETLQEHSTYTAVDVADPTDPPAPSSQPAAKTSN
jgi:murein DD-endopeptidase MepM/ murein hydrolase activator NlpD